MNERDEEVSPDDKEAVEQEIGEIREFVESLKVEDLKTGNWFEKLLAHALAAYTQKVDADYFREKYPHSPVDTVVHKRIEMAARYASIEGTLTASAYTTAVVATIGSAGGASPLSLPAGAAAFMVDLTYLSQAQLKLAYDISVLYRVPLDLDDPDDLWKLVRIAFSVKVGEGAQQIALKGIPAFLRPLLKKYYSGGVLAAAKAFPVVGRHLLQRNVIKFAIPAVTIPATAGVNFWSTRATGHQAQNILRLEARIIEAADRIVERNTDLIPLLWAMWMTAKATNKVTEEQHNLFHHVAVRARQRGVPEEDLAEIRDVIDVDRVKVWAKLSAVEDLRPIYEAAITMASINGRPSEDALHILKRMARTGGLEFREEDIDDVVRQWRTGFQAPRELHLHHARRTARATPEK